MLTAKSLAKLYTTIISAYYTPQIMPWLVNSISHFVFEPIYLTLLTKKDVGLSIVQAFLAYRRIDLQLEDEMQMRLHQV